ncbi:MAG: hypothetical protein HWE14_01695 [Flavobacteriia bacterium]|nr:hypothetical protein [Flavobacteriia bacterium]
MRSNVLKWLLPVLAIVIANIIYFYPALQGKELVQDDILLGKAKGKSIVDYREATGEEPLWTNAMFSGMPTFQLSIKYPNNWLGYVQSTINTVLVKNSSIYMIASMMLGMFFLLRTYKVDPWLSVAGAIALGFSAFFIISMAAGHNAKVRTAVYIAPMLMGILLTLRGRQLLGFALTALMVGLSIQSNHFQVTYYSIFIILPILVVYGIKMIKNGQLNVFIKRSLILAAAAALGVGPNIGNLWSTMAYTQETMRGGHSALVEEQSESAESDGASSSTEEGLSFDYAMGWSMTKAETFNLFIPMFAGGGAKENYEGTDLYERVTQGRSVPANQKAQINGLIGTTLYWGESMTNGSYYLGAVVFFLFILALVTVKGSTRQWVIASIIIALMLAWGKNLEWFNRFMFENLPFYNKFRVPSMAVVILCTVIPFFGFLGLQKFINLAKEDKDAAKKVLMRTLYIAGGILLAVALIGPALFSLAGDRDQQMVQYWSQIQMPLSLNEMEDARASLMRSSAFTSLIFAGLTFGALFLYLRGTFKAQILGFVMIGLVVVDLWSFDKDHLNADSFVSSNQYLNEFRPTRADQFILKDTDPHYRVWNTTQGLTSDSRTSFYHKSIGGYHGAKLARYQDLINEQLSQQNMEVFNMLNTKWVIYEANGETMAEANVGAAGNAWFPTNAIWVNGPVNEMNALDDFKAGTDVVIDQSMKDALEGTVRMDSNVRNTIALTSYDPKEMHYTAKVQGQPALAVFSEIWYDAPGQPWKLYIDGEETELYRVNYLLRSAVIPAGEHEIVMKFEPKTYYMGEQIDLVFSILLFLALGGAIVQEVRTQKKAEHKEA